MLTMAITGILNTNAIMVFYFISKSGLKLYYFPTVQQHYLICAIIRVKNATDCFHLLLAKDSIYIISSIECFLHRNQYVNHDFGRRLACGYVQVHKFQREIRKNINSILCRNTRSNPLLGFADHNRRLIVLFVS